MGAKPWGNFLPCSLTRLDVPLLTMGRSATRSVQRHTIQGPAAPPVASEARQTGQTVALVSETTRSDQTNAQYVNKQKHWREWCRKCAVVIRGGLTFQSSRARSLRTRVLHRPWQWSLLRERARQTHMAKWNMLLFCERIPDCALCFSSHFTYLLGQHHICTMTPSAHALTSFHHSGHKYPKSRTTFPSFQKRSNWYDLPLLCRHHDVTLDISYPAQNKSMKRALASANIRSKKVTHASRVAGARIAEENGASPEEVARAGRWASGVMEAVYLSSFPLPATRAMAEFASQRGSYYLPRAVPVPASLQRKVFPEVERWRVASLLH